MKIYVGNLNYDATEDDLNSLFSETGNLVSVSIIKDRDTGSSKGFGFVEYESAECGEEAISKFDGHDFKGRKLRVSQAKERAPRPKRGGGGGNRY